VPLTIPPNVRHAERLHELAREARERGAGLWSSRTCDGDPDRPVDYVQSWPGGESGPPPAARRRSPYARIGETPHRTRRTCPTPARRPTSARVGRRRRGRRPTPSRPALAARGSRRTGASPFEPLSSVE
jgi:hypothetical protein